jgi:hypothetical protein
LEKTDFEKNHKKRAGRVAQGVGPEFKPQYCKEKKRKRQGDRAKVRRAAWPLIKYSTLSTSVTSEKLSASVCWIGLLSLLLFWWVWGLNSGLCACKAVLLPLVTALVHFSLDIFGDGGLMDHLAGLALNHNPLYLSLSSN